MSKFDPYGPWLRASVHGPNYVRFAQDAKLVPGVRERSGTSGATWVVPENAGLVFAGLIEQHGMGVSSAQWVVPRTKPATWEEVRAALLARGEMRPEFIDDFPVEHQREGVALYWNAVGGHYWVGTGGGKTWMGIAIAMAQPGPVLFVTRSAARMQVAREIERFTTSKAFVFRAESVRTKELRVNGLTWRDFVQLRMPQLRNIKAVADAWEALKARIGVEVTYTEQTLDSYLLDAATKGYRPWGVVGWESLLLHAPAIYSTLKPTVLIDDEAHLGKNGRNFDVAILPPLHGDPNEAFAQRRREKEEAEQQDGFIREDVDPETGLLQRRMFVPVESRATMCRKIARDLALKRIALTATPIYNRVSDLYGQVSAIEPNCWGSMSAFHLKYCDAHPGVYGGMDTSGESNIEELQLRLRGRTFVVPSHRAQAHMMHLKRRQSVYVTPEDQVAELPGIANALKQARKEGGLSRLEAERLVASSKKRGVVTSLLSNHIGEAHKCVVFTARKRDCDDIGRRIHAAKWGRHAQKPTVWVAHGDVSIEARDAIVQEYMAHPGPCVLIATGQSFGESLNLDDTDAVLFIQLPYTPGELRQWEGRFFRLSTKRPVVIYYVIAEGTIDERIADILINKLPAVETISEDSDLAAASSTLGGVDELDPEEFAAAVLASLDW